MFASFLLHKILIDWKNRDVQLVFPTHHVHHDRQDNAVNSA